MKGEGSAYCQMRSRPSFRRTEWSFAGRARRACTTWIAGTARLNVGYQQPRSEQGWVKRAREERSLHEAQEESGEERADEAEKLMVSLNSA